MGLLDLFKSLGRLIVRAGKAAKAAGLTSQFETLALQFVRQASVQFTDNTERREWAVGQLVKAGLPEAVSRFAVESAVQVWKSKVQ